MSKKSSLGPNPASQTGFRISPMLPLGKEDCRRLDWFICLASCEVGEGMEPADTGKTVWAHYEKAHSYNDAEAKEKADFIREFSREVQPNIF